MSRFLVVTGVLSMLSAGFFWVNRLPGGEVLLGLAAVQLGAALVGAVLRSRRENWSRGEAAQVARVAAEAGFLAGRALTLCLQAGQIPEPLTVWGLVLRPGERAYLDAPVAYSRFYGRDVGYRRSSTLYLGGGGPGLAFAAGCLMLGESIEQSRAIRSAQPQWRDLRYTRAIVTSERLLVLAGAEWAEFWLGYVKAFYPDPQAGQIVLEFSGGCAPVCLRGPATPSVMAYLCWVLHGASGLRTHPSLQALR